ncbi:MAG: hypothetical protein SGPRY_007408 [Prymnesium sp.]
MSKVIVLLAAGRPHPGNTVLPDEAQLIAAIHHPGRKSNCGNRLANLVTGLHLLLTSMDCSEDSRRIFELRPVTNSAALPPTLRRRSHRMFKRDLRRHQGTSRAAPVRHACWAWLP